MSFRRHDSVHRARVTVHMRPDISALIIIRFRVSNPLHGVAGLPETGLDSGSSQGPGDHR